MREIKQGSTATVPFFVTTTDHITGATAITLLSEFSLNGGAFSTVTAPTVTEIDYGWYKLNLSTVHTASTGDVAFHVTATAGADITDFKMNVTPFNWVDVGTMSTKINDLYNVEFGAWRVDTTADTLTLFKKGDTTTSVAVFNLTRQTGTQPYYSERTT